MKKYYTDNGVREICHLVKDGNNSALYRMAIDMGYCLVSNHLKDCVIIPMPSHYGYATYTLSIAKRISRMIGCEVADILRCKPHKSLYDAKLNGETITSTELGFYLQGEYPTDKPIIIIDNVCDSGTTAFAALDVIPNANVLVYAFNEKNKTIS